MLVSSLETCVIVIHRSAPPSFLAWTPFYCSEIPSFFKILSSRNSFILISFPNSYLPIRVTNTHDPFPSFKMMLRLSATCSSNDQFLCMHSLELEPAALCHTSSSVIHPENNSVCNIYKWLPEVDDCLQLPSLLNAPKEEPASARLQLPLVLPDPPKEPSATLQLPP